MRHNGLEPCTRVLHRLCILSVAASLALASCGTDDDATGKVVEDPIAAGLLPADWPGLAMGIAPPQFRDEGKVDFVRGDKRVVPEPREIFPSDPNFEHIPENEVTLFDGPTGRQYHVTLPDGIDLVAAARAAELAQKVMAVPTAAEPAIGDPKRVSGKDTRVRLGIRDGVPKEGWMAAIGLRFTGSTGVLIGPNAYLTAAHTVYNTKGKLDPTMFFPREDWVDPDPFNAAPWGAWDDQQIFVPGAFTQNNCHVKFTADCVQYDIALVRVKRDPSATAHRWWFTPAAETRAELESRQLKNRGYAQCEEIKEGRLMDATDRPPNCESGHSSTLWGDQKSCALGQDRYADPYSAEVFHTCDTNGGHSGSPMFYYRADGSPVLIGVHSSGNTAAAGEAINSFKRFSPNTLRWINGLL